jgi:Fe-S oxidoreductase
MPMRGHRDRTIPVDVRAEFASALICNGNGACFNFDPNDAMCPSWKATRDRIHSPKGRASLMREWLRLLAESGSEPKYGTLLARLRATLGRRRGEYDFSHEVRDAMAGCLSCKSCATQCPIRVDVAELRSQFLERYHGRYLRPLRHHAVCGMEGLLPFAARAPRLYNAVSGSRIGQRLTKRFAGLVDSPRLSETDLHAEVRDRGIAWATPAVLAAMAPAERERTVVVVQDAFTTFFETRVLLDAMDLLRHLGFTPLPAPFMANGKALHVHGFGAGFDRVAARNAAYLSSLADSGIPLVGVEPAVTLTYRQEYAAALGAARAPRVQLLQEWLATKAECLKAHAIAATAPFELLAHCTEKTAASSSSGDWQRVFAALGQSLNVPPVGCCGMAGTYGHEAEHADTSRRIYAQSWSAMVNDPARKGRLVATGYSCRSQARRIDGIEIAHPAQALLELLTGQRRHGQDPD